MNYPGKNSSFRQPSTDADLIKEPNDNVLQWFQFCSMELMSFISKYKFIFNIE